MKAPDTLVDTQAGTSPNLVSGPSSPLEALFLRALRRFGEMAASTVEADAISLALDYGNEVIDDILGHPYFPAGGALPYYTHPSDCRGIPDHIVVAGLLFRHAADQKSKAADRYEVAYYAKLNQLMARVKFGTGAEFRLQAVDYSDAG